MLLYLLSTCPVFLEGYVFALSKQFRNIKWQSFVNPESALNRDLPVPSVLVIKPVGFTDITSFISSVRFRYPTTPILAVLPPGTLEGQVNEHSIFDSVIWANEGIDLIAPRFRDCLLQFDQLVDGGKAEIDTELFSVFDKYKSLNKREVDLFRALAFGSTVKDLLLFC